MQQDFFKDLQKEILELRDKFPHLSPDSAFVAWFMRAFITENEKEAVESLTGSAGDKSSDAIYIDHDNRIVFIVQGKYHQRSTALESRSNVIALADLGRVLMTERKEGYEAVLNKANPSVKDLLSEARKLIHQRDYRLAVRYVTTGRISDTNINEGKSRLDDFETAEFETFTYKDLMKLMLDYIEGAAPPVPTVTLTVQGAEVFNRSDNHTGITSWIFTMAGNDVGKLFNDLGVRLFARNIRGFLGKGTKVNRALKSTIQKEPEYFWYYNNGITIVCDEAKQIKRGNSNIMRIANSQIINGQQTTRTLALAGKNDAEVLVKLIEIPRDSDHRNNQYRHLVSEIVSATNWQNAISQSDLKSNDIEQVRIEKEFKKLGYFYIRKRMSKLEARKYGGDKYSFKIKKDTLARAIAACTVDPYEVRLGKDRLFEDDIYSKIFNGRKATEYLSLYWLYQYAEYWSRGSIKTVSAKWHVLHLLWSLLSNDLRKNFYRDQFRLMVERDRYYQNELEPLNKLVKESFRFASAFYMKNKKIDGRIQDPRDFFKHINLHKQMEAFLRKNSFNTRLKTHCKDLLQSIQKAAEAR